MKKVNMKKVASGLVTAVLLLTLSLSVNILMPETVHADTTGGWHLVGTNYYLSTLDYTVKGEIQNGIIGTSDVIYDKYAVEGSEGDMTITHSRRYDNGKGIAHVTYQVIWDTPPAYIASGQKTGFNIGYKVISSNKWGGVQINAHFDSASIKPGSGSSSYIAYKLADGTAYISKNSQGYFESEKVIPAGSPGAKKAIILTLGNGYGYTYIYEWKEGAAPAVSAPNSTDSPLLTGEWSIIANGLKGKINITDQTGVQFSGTVHIDAGKTEQLTNGSISGSNVAFTRMWEALDIRQDYTGTLTIDEKGNATIVGTFSQGKKSGQGMSGSWSWSATKMLPIPVASAAPATPVSAGSGAEPFESGARIMWQPANGLGYRLFRSATPNELGISVTDFYITSTSYADVNVEPKTTYYYTVKPVLAEAKPFEGIDEKLGGTIATFTVTTGDQVYKPGSYKHFIMLKLEDPNMSVDGVNQEVDPGRGTAPVVIAGRTMVPIRAVVEAMGGSVGWDAATKKITLTARGNTVEMWLGKTDIKINGASKKMDVAPVSKNDRTFVPVRFAAENMNCKVDWINSTKEAVIVYEE